MSEHAESDSSHRLLLEVAVKTRVAAPQVGASDLASLVIKAQMQPHFSYPDAHELQGSGRRQHQAAHCKCPAKRPSVFVFEVT